MMEGKWKSGDSEVGGLKSCPHNKVRNILSQLVAASSKYLIMLNIGMGISFSTVAIPPILNAKEGLSLTQDESTWFASLVFIFQPVGSLASVPLSGLGRKRSMFYLQIPLFLAWILPYFAETVWELYFASFVMGLGIGFMQYGLYRTVVLFPHSWVRPCLCYRRHQWLLEAYLTLLLLNGSILFAGIGFMQAPIATYIGEVTQPKYRGLLACTAYCFLTLGSVLVYAIDVINGYWRHTSLFCSLMPILTAVLLYIIPESPVWLVSRGRNEDAKKSLAWLRGWVSEAEVEDEYNSIVYHNSPKYAALMDSGGPAVIDDGELGQVNSEFTPNYETMETKLDNSEKAPETNSDNQNVTPNVPANKVEENTTDEQIKKESFLSYLCRPEMYRPLVLSAVFLYLSNGVGVATFRSYLILIFQEYKVKEIDENIATVAVTSIGLIGNIFSVVLMPLVGKRKLALVGVFLCAVGCAALGLYSFLGQDMNMTWIPIVIMILIFFATNLGVGHIPWVLMSEIFPLRGRTLATAAVAGFGNFLQFIGTKLFLTFNEWLTLGGTFFMYSATFLIGNVYLYFFLFETEGKSLDEITAIFRGKKKR